MPDIVFRFRGDEHDSVRAARAVREALEGIQKETKGVSQVSRASAQTTQAAARESVAARARERAELERLAREYRNIASNARSGSRIQVVAAEQAERAEKQLGLIVDRTTGSYRRQSTAEREAARTAGQAARGAIAGTSAYRGFGRSIAFASSTFLGAAGIIHLTEEAVKGAADEERQIDRTRVVLKSASAGVLAWAQTTAKSMGVADDAALKMTNDLATMLVPMGVAPEKAAAMGEELVKLAADIGSLRGIDPTAVFQAFTRGVAGQMRGLKQYGVVIDENRIKAEALRLGLVKSTADMAKVEKATTAVAVAEAKLADAQKRHTANSTQVAQAQQALKNAQAQLDKQLAGHVGELDRATKAQAIYSLILKDTTTAHGAFARNIDRAGEQQKILRAELNDLSDELGKDLLPTIGNVIHGMTDWMGVTGNQKRLQEGLHQAVEALLKGLQVAWQVLQVGKGLFEGLADAVGGTENAIKLLIALKVASWLQAMTGGLAMTIGSATTGLVGAEAKAAALRSTLGRLGSMAAITIGVELLIHASGDTGALAAIERVGGGALIGGAVAGLPGAAVGAGFLGGREAAKALFGGKGFDPTKDDGTTTVDVKPWQPLHAPEPGTVTHIGHSGTVSANDPSLPSLDVPGGSPKQSIFVYQLVFVGDSGASYTFNNVIPAVTKGKHYPAGTLLAKASPTGKVIFHYSHPVTSRVPKAPGGSTTPGAGGATVAEKNILVTPDHDTHGAHLKPAFGQMGTRNLDEMRSAGTIVGAPEAGYIHHLSGSPYTGTPGSGAYGLSLYFVGTDTGNIYYMTHFAKLLVSPGDTLRRGDPLGVVAFDHIHVELAPPGYVMAAAGAQSAATASGTGGTTTTTVPNLVVDTTPKKPKVAAKPLVAQHFYDAVANARVAVKKAATDFRQDAAIRDEIAAMLNLEDALKAAEAKATGKRKTALHKAVLAVQSDVATAQKELRSVLASEAKAQSKRQEHDALASTVAMLLGASGIATGPEGQGGVAGVLRSKSTAALKKMASLAAEVAADRTKAAPLATLADDMVVAGATDSLGRPLPATTVAALKKKVKQLFDAVAKAVTPADKKAAAIALSKGIDDALSQASTAVSAARSKFEDAFSYLGDVVLSGFDRVTSSHLSAMQAAVDVQSNELQRETDAQMSALQKQTDAQLVALDKAMQHRLDQLQADADARVAELQRTLSAQVSAIETAGAASTPGEAALAALTGAHDAAAHAEQMSAAQSAVSEAASALKKAQATRDKTKIAAANADLVAAEKDLDELLYQEKVDALQKQADAERKVQDAQTQSAVDAATEREKVAEDSIQKELAARQAALQRQLADQQQALQDELAAKQQALQEDLANKQTALQRELVAQQQNYQDQREAQKRQLQVQLESWKLAVETGQATYADFVKWMQGEQRPGGLLEGVDIPDPVAAMGDAGDSQGTAFATEFIRALNEAAKALGAFIAKANQGVNVKVNYSSNGGPSGSPDAHDPPNTGGGGGSSSGNSGSACFVASTPVWTPEGDRHIGGIAVGDRVYTWDFDKLAPVVSVVVDVQRHEHRKTLVLTTDIGTVEVTAEHLFWTGAAWVTAGDLIPGVTTVVDRDGATHLVRGVSPGSTTTVHNLHVGHADHNYFADGHLVHNLKPTFDLGGIVPGSLGRPVDATVHAGELILTAAQQRNLAAGIGSGGRGPVVVNINNPTFLTGDRSAARRFSRTIQAEINKQITVNY